MQNSTWHPKPGDRFFRPRRIKRTRLRRILGVPALFSAGYANVGSSIYYALGIVAVVALGGTPVALAIAGIIYIFNALTYAEGSAVIPEAGGSASFARHAFSDLGGFIGGWALMLSYIATISISANTVSPYLAYFFPELREPMVGTALSMGIILFLMLVNLFGIRESTILNTFFIAIDIATQVTLIILGAVFILFVKPDILWQHMFGPGNWPSVQNLIFGTALAALAFTGVETVSQMAQETRHPGEQIPKAYGLMVVTVLLLFAGISVVALSAMTPQMLADPVNGWARDPVAGIAANLPSPMLREVFAPLVAVLAASILLTAANAGIIGISRLAFNMSTYQLLPAAFGRVHARFRTPYMAIILFSMLALLLMIPQFFYAGFFEDLGALYAFGSLLSFAVAHAAVLALRAKRPDLPRPFKLRGNIRLGGKEMPVTAILGLVSTVTVWLVLTISEPFSRVAGSFWLLIGLVLFSLYRRRKQLPLTHTTKEVI